MNLLTTRKSKIGNFSRVPAIMPINPTPTFGILRTFWGQCRCHARGQVFVSGDKQQQIGPIPGIYTFASKASDVPDGPVVFFSWQKCS